MPERIGSYRDASGDRAFRAVARFSWRSRNIPELRAGDPPAPWRFEPGGVWFPTSLYRPRERRGSGRRAAFRISDYVDNGKASDFVTAKGYLAKGKAYYRGTMSDINALRAQKGLPKLVVPL